MARKKIVNENKQQEPKNMTLKERIENLQTSRMQMQQGLLKVEGALEVLIGMLQQEENADGKKE